MDSPLPPRAQDSWDSMLPGPPNRSNSASSDVSSGGLLAYGSGSSVAFIDPRSMQFVSVLPMPAPSASSPLRHLRPLGPSPPRRHRDPFDSRHFFVIGLRGFLLSAIVLGDGVGDVSIQEHQILNSGGRELEKLEKEKDLSSSAASANVSPASPLFPMFFVRFCFSPR